MKQESPVKLMGLTIKSYAEWTHYKKGSNEEIEISKSFRDEMIKKEQTLEIEIQYPIGFLPNN